MTYEQAIRARAERLGLRVVPRIEGTSRLELYRGDTFVGAHRLGGDAEAKHDERMANPERFPEPGYWAAPPVEGITWTPRDYPRSAA